MFINNVDRQQQSMDIPIQLQWNEIEKKSHDNHFTYTLYMCDDDHQDTHSEMDKEKKTGVEVMTKWTIDNDDDGFEKHW